MSDTPRTYPQLQTIFVDNTSGLITAQDSRDFIATSQGYVGQQNPNNLWDSNDSASVGAYFDTGSKVTNTSGGLVFTCLDGSSGNAKWVQTQPQTSFGGGFDGVISWTWTEPFAGSHPFWYHFRRWGMHWD